MWSASQPLGRAAITNGTANRVHDTPISQPVAPRDTQEQGPADVVDTGGEPEGGRGDQRAGHRTAPPQPGEPVDGPVRVGACLAQRRLPGWLDDAGARDGRGAGHHARGQEHDPHVVDTDDRPDERADGHAGDLGAEDGGERPAAALDGDRAGHHGERGDRRATCAEALQSPAAGWPWPGRWGAGRRSWRRRRRRGRRAAPACGRCGRRACPPGTGRARRRRRTRPSPVRPVCRSRPGGGCRRAAWG